MASGPQKVASLYADVGMNVTPAVRASRDVGSRLLTLQNQFKTLRDQAKITGTGITQAFAIGTGIGAAVKAFEVVGSAILGVKGAIDDTVTSIGDYDKFSKTFAFLTKANSDVMAKFDAAAAGVAASLSLPQFKRADAAEAMLDLAKSGLSATDAIAAVTPALNLAAAGGASAGAAAEGLANAMNMFHLSGKDATQTADLIAGAMKHSGQTLGEMMDSLSMAGATFDQAKQPMNAFLAAVAELGKAGIRGSQAGSSLQQMMLSLISPTDEAKGMLTGLGVHAYYDNSEENKASGLANTMKPLRAIIDEMTPALQRLNEAQRNQYLSTIFGSNAVRAASIIFGQGTQAFDEMKDAISELGVAQGLATAQSSGLSGALEGLKKSFSDALFVAIKPMTPALTEAAGKISGFIKGISDLTADSMKSSVGIFALAGAFTALGAASIASGDIGGGLTYALLGIMTIVDEVGKSLGSLDQIFTSIFGKGGKGGGPLGSGGVTVALTPILGADSAKQLQAAVDALPPFVRVLALNPVLGAIPTIGALSAVVNLTLGPLPAIPTLAAVLSLGLGVLPVVPLLPAVLALRLGALPTVPTFSAALTLLPSFKQVQDAVSGWALVKAALSFNLSQAETQAMVDGWSALKHGLELSPQFQQVQELVTAWALVKAAMSFTLSFAETQLMVDAWAAFKHSLKLDLSFPDVKAAIDQWNPFTHTINLVPQIDLSGFKTAIESALGQIDWTTAARAIAAVVVAAASARGGGLAPEGTGAAAGGFPGGTGGTGSSGAGGGDVTALFRELSARGYGSGSLDYLRQAMALNGYHPSAAQVSGAISSADAQGARGTYDITRIAHELGVPGFASGGAVGADRPILVGERGPELFVPGASGAIVPNGAGSYGGGGDTHVNFYGPVYGFHDFEDHVVLAMKTAGQKGRT